MAFILLPLLSLLVTSASAQCHLSSGQGISKTTYAGFENLTTRALRDMILLFNNTPASDSSPGNTQPCQNESSGSAPWFITMSRSETIMPTVALQQEFGGPLGSCLVYSTLVSSASNGTDAVDDEKVYILPPAGPTEDCTYSSLPPAASYASASPGEESTYNAHSSSTCCNTCAALGECAYATYSPPSPNQTKPSTVAGPVPGECFGLHVTSIPGHSTDPGPSVETVQDAFSAKFAASLAGEIFDPFLDYNVALFTADIDHYLRRADALGMPYLAASWPYTPSSSPSSSSSSSSSFSSEETGFSVLIQIGGSQLIVELLALSSPALAARSPPPLVLEQRMTDARVAAFAAAPPDGSRLAVASIGRAASEESFAALEDFYVNGAGATVSMNTTGTAAAGAEKLCFLWPGAAADVCFTLRASTAPATPTAAAAAASDDDLLTVADFEAVLWSQHELWLRGKPNCAMDRWVDNHCE
jgi:hypothetical protein